MLSDAHRTTRDDLAGLLRRSLALEDQPAAIVSLDASGQSASAILVRLDDEWRKAQVRTALEHIAAAKRLIREATR